uniref:Integrator complex subunit 8 n=1 Tax=Panagrellus redivivus TaxID=6233 RepID=A0A7E4WDW6_PANRE
MSQSARPFLKKRNRSQHLAKKPTSNPSTMPLESVDFLPAPPVVVEDEHMDYFLRRDELKAELIANDDEFCCSLIKQYMKRIQATEKELLMTAEGLGEDGVTVLTAKKNDLYNCCFAGLAKLNWDFVRIAKGVPSSRFRALLKYLVTVTFPNKTEITNAVDAEIFNELNALPLEEFTEDTLFTAWLYARWIVFIDRTARFPIIVAKQTVANPAASTDQALLQAEQHGRCIFVTRQQTAKAVEFLTKLESSNIKRIRVPTIDCFINKHPMNVENLNIWEFVITPDFGASSLYLSMEEVLNRTRYELLVANFSANHFRTAKRLCQLLLDLNISFCETEDAALAYVQFDLGDVEFYAKALGVNPDIPPLKCRDSMVAKAQGVQQIYDAKMVAVSKRIQAIEASKADEKSKLRVSAANFFLKQLESPPARQGVAPVRAPTAQEFDEFPSDGPPAFWLYTTTVADAVKSLLTVPYGLKPYSFPERFDFSPNLAEAIYQYIDKNDRNKEKFFIIIGKTFQLQNVNLTSQWEHMTNALLPLFADNKNKQYLEAVLIIETLQLKLLQTCSSFQQLPNELFVKIKNAYQSVNASSSTCIRFYRYFLPAMLNTGRSEEIERACNKCVDDAVVPFMLTLKDLINATGDASYIKKKFYQAFSKLLKNYSYDTSNKSVFTFKNFITMIQHISHQKAIRLLLSYTLQIYNKEIRDHPEHFLISSAQRSCYTFGDTYSNNEQIKWGRVDNVLSDTLATVLQSANRFLSADPYVLRATGDYLFTIGNYDCALRNYLNCLLVCTRHLSQPLYYHHPGIDDVFWKKVITCLIELKRPTEAAITGHLIIQMFDFFPHIIRILEPTTISHDAIEAYFPLIGDIAIYEAMSSAYGRLGHKRLQQKLISSVLTKTFNANGSKTLLIHEGLRRKTNWIRVLCSRVFIEK